ncbi:hypothetical protein ABK040_002592 [Willaertia magna]
MQKEPIFINVEPTSVKPIERQGSSLISLFDKINNKEEIYLFGGRISSKHSTNKKERNIVNDLWKGTFSSDLKKIEWKCILEHSNNNQFMEKRHNHSAIACDNKIIIFGGSNNEKYFNDVIEFNISTNTFDNHLNNNNNNTKIPNARHGHSAILYNNECMVIFGGKFDFGMYSEYGNDIWFYNLKTKTWQKIEIDNNKQQPIGRCWHSAVLYQNRFMLVFGGFYSKGVEYYLNDLWSFDLELKEWNLLSKNEDINKSKKLNIPIPRNRCGSFINVDKLFVFFGNYFDGTVDHFLKDFYYFDLKEEKWVNINNNSSIKQKTTLSLQQLGMGHFNTFVLNSYLNDTNNKEKKERYFIFGGEVEGHKRSNDVKEIVLD